MLAARFMTGLSLVAAFLIVVILDEQLAPWFPFWFVTVMLVMTLGARELTELLKQTSVRPSGNTVMGGCILLILANWMPHLIRHYAVAASGGFGLPHDPMEPILVMAWPLWAFVAIVMFAFVAQSIQFERPGGTMAAISGTILAVAYIGILGGFVIQMRWLTGKYHGLIPLIYLVSTAKFGDVGAYTFGRIFGRHKLWPRLSPNKTVEGAVGGALFGVLASLIVTAVAMHLLHAEHLGWGLSVGFGLVVGAAAQLGDLMESMIKRDCARKDASDTLPGFGGVLDVLDSILFAAPVAYGYWVWFGP